MTFCSFKSEKVGFDIEKASFKRINEEELFFIPKVIGKDGFNNFIYDYEFENNNEGGIIPYWYAFLEYPYSSGEYNPEFLSLNKN